MSNRSDWRASAPTERSYHCPSAAHDSRGMPPTSIPGCATSRPSTGHASPAHHSWPAEASARPPVLSQPAPEPVTRTSWMPRSGCGGRSLQAVVLKNLDSVVVRIGHVHSIVLINKQTRRKLELSQCSAASSEGIKQLPLTIEYLD